MGIVLLAATVPLLAAIAAKVVYTKLPKSVT